jgi:hypothetical protein
MNVKKTFLSGDLNEEVYLWNNLGGLLLIDKKKKFVSLLNNILFKIITLIMA